MIASVAFGVLVPILSLQFVVPGFWSFVIAGALAIALIGTAILLPRRTARPATPSAGRRRRGIAWIAFFATDLHFGLTYAAPSTGLPWPAGTALSLALIAIGILLM